MAITEEQRAEFDTARLLEIGDEIARLTEQDDSLAPRMAALRDIIVQYEKLIDAPPVGRLAPDYGTTVPRMSQDLPETSRDGRP